MRREAEADDSMTTTNHSCRVAEVECGRLGRLHSMRATAPPASGSVVVDVGLSATECAGEWHCKFPRSSSGRFNARLAHSRLSALIRMDATTLRLAHCSAAVTLGSVGFADETAALGIPRSHVERELGASACRALNDSASVLLAASLTAAPSAAETAQQQTRIGAELAFGVLGLLSLLTLGTLACACRQRALRRRKDRARYQQLIYHYSRSQPDGPISKAAEPLLPSRPAVGGDSFGNGGGDDDERGASSNLGSLVRRSLLRPARAWADAAHAAARAAWNGEGIFGDVGYSDPTVLTGGIVGARTHPTACARDDSSEDGGGGGGGDGDGADAGIRRRTRLEVAALATKQRATTIATW